MMPRPFQLSDSTHSFMLAMAPVTTKNRRLGPMARYTDFAARSDSLHQFTVPDGRGPRYRDWDLAQFTRFAERELVRHARSARVRAAYKGDSRIPEQNYPELGEYAGFAYIDDARALRSSASRIGRYWLGKPVIVAWPPGEQGAREQLIASLRKKSRSDARWPALAAIWWTDSGVVQARFADLASGEALCGSWRIEPRRGVSGLFARALQLGNNDVIRVAPNIPARYAI